MKTDSPLAFRVPKDKGVPRVMDEAAGAGPVPATAPTFDTAFGRPRSFLGNRYVYAVISQRAGGLSIGVNLTPDKRCNFQCAYCEVDRDQPGASGPIDLRILRRELEDIFRRMGENRLGELERYRALPGALLELREMALSGDGEPALSPQFEKVLQTVLYFRARGRHTFKLVLLTNTAGLNRPQIRRALRLLTCGDEVWVKLDAGAEDYMNRVNAPDIHLEEVLRHILELGRQRPVVVQSLFPRLHHKGPPPEEIEAYAQRLLELKRGGARIEQVQVYSAHRPPHLPTCSHLPLRQLSRIARRVRQVTGLRAEVF